MNVRVGSLPLTAGICALALHVLLILLTGGYSVGAFGITIAGHDMARPLMLLLGLVILRLAVRHRAVSPDVSSSHEVAILFSAVLLIYLANGRTIWSGDTVPARYLPLSILREGNLDLDEFPFLFEDKFPFPYFLQFVNGHYVSDYPVGAALLALPVYLPSALGHVNPQHPLIGQLEKLSAAAIVALSAAGLYLTLRRLTSGRESLVITGVYALGTSSLSESSQALWQHGASQLAISAALYCLVRGRQDARWLAFAGFPLAFAIISRPTDVLLALPLGLYVFFHHRRQLGGFLLAGSPPALFQLWYNATYFGNPFRVQFSLTALAAVRGLLAGAETWSVPLWSGLAGILLSPARGLFVYSPVFLLSVVGIGLAWRRNGDPLLRYASVGVILTLVVYGKWSNWWGGTSYGPRLLADLSPVLALCLSPLGPVARRRRALSFAFVILAVWSVGAHSIGAFADDRSWNRYERVDEFPERLWSWTNNPLVNPVTETVERAVIAIFDIPTSVTAPALVAVSYHTDSPPTLTLEGCKTIPLSVAATNAGRAVWLPQSRNGEGAVSLGWRWRRGDHVLPWGTGRVPLRWLVFHGQSYEFRSSIVAPPEPGAYLLEVGLVTDGGVWLSEPGSPPIRMAVTVDSAPGLPEPADAFLVLQERGPGEDGPSFALFTDQPRYRPGDVLRLSLTASIGGRAWLVDTYLLLQGPSGARWLFDGRRLVRGGDCAWTPLSRASRLQKGWSASGPLMHFRLTGMPPGAYTWRFLITEVERYRIIASGQANFDLTPPADPGSASR